LALIYPGIYNNITKRKELIRYLESHGAYLIREGRRHSIYQKDKYRTEIPRHNEIVDELAKKICRDLGISFLK
jgi:predicted RNA binding protein YcfA (HicA-like mRNA interferase family)